MPVVPRYDQPTVESNALPMAQFNAPQAKNFAIEEGQQAMAGMQKLGTVGALVANDMQAKANQLRVDEALNQAKEEYFRLSYDKDAGFLNVRGKDAVERPSGKPLADEYAETYREQLGKISAGLGNDAQRQAFSVKAGSLATSMSGRLPGPFKAESRGEILCCSPSASSSRRGSPRRSTSSCNGP